MSDSLKWLALLGSLALAAGCGPHRWSGGSVPSPAATYRILPGAGTIIAPGQQAGYGITANTGSAFRLVWTGQAQVSGTYNEFWGSIYTSGTFQSVVPGCGDGSCPLEGDDYVSGIIPAAGGERVDFDCFASTGIDGIDFVVNGEPAIFDFYIDNAQYPNLVFFPATDNGGAVSTVSVFPFGLVTT
jgi:hypothetical protein